MLFKNFILTFAVACLTIVNCEAVVRKIIHTDKAPPAIASYSQGVQIDNMLYVSGSIGMSVDGILADGIANQTTLTLNNIGHILEAAGTTFEKVIKVSVMMTDIADYTEINSIYGQYFYSKPPARSAYEVTNLPRGALIEMEVVAVVGEIIEENGMNASSESKTFKYLLFISCFVFVGLF